MGEQQDDDIETLHFLFFIVKTSRPLDQSIEKKPLSREFGEDHITFQKSYCP